MRKVKIMVSFNGLRAGEVFDVDDSFFRKYRTYLQALPPDESEFYEDDEPLADVLERFRDGEKSVTEKPEAGDGAGADLPGEG